MCAVKVAARDSRSGQAINPPKFIIDLSLPPRDRYKSLAAEYSAKLRALTGLFDDLLLGLSVPDKTLSTINRLSKLLLRRLRDGEQTEELRGISEQTGIAMYLLVSLNVVLDLLMGCTSGGVQSLERRRTEDEARMLHFRLLDWGMDGLRDTIVQLDFVKTKSSNPHDILASSITYVGFVGVLTGVRRGLSMSLNFRAVHNGATWVRHARFYSHHILVLLGFRPSIASLLRSCLLHDVDSDLATVVEWLRSQHTTAAYLILSNGQTTMTIEKDYSDARVRESQSFIAMTNHDIENSINVSDSVVHNSGVGSLRNSSGVQDIIEESHDRLGCIEEKWHRKMRRAQKGRERSTTGNNSCYVTKQELVEWISDWPTTNECTHFAAIMDPVVGEVIWSRAYPNPLQEPIRSVQYL